MLLDEGFVVPDNMDTIVAFCHEIDGRAELPNLMTPSSAGSENFELQFVGTLDTPDLQRNINRWSGTCNN